MTTTEATIRSARMGSQVVQVGALKLTFHYGIAVAQVAIASFSAMMLRSNTVARTIRQLEVERSNALLSERQVELEMGNQQLQDQAVEMEVAHEQLLDAATEHEPPLERTRLARNQADDANAAKAKFLAVMSHELRTPLNAIGGYSELLEMGIRGPVTSEQLDDLGRIRRAQKHLLSLVNDILNFAKLEAGEVLVHVENVGVAEVLADVAGLVQPLVQAKALTATVARDCDALVVRADRERLRQILLNLLGNAVKFTSAGSISVTCAATADVVTIAVRDTGGGIPPEKLGTIFELFVQLDRSLVSTHGGAGLGLAISRELAVAMGGSIDAESTVGQGSVFSLTLPRSNDCVLRLLAPRACARTTIAERRCCL